MEFFRIKRDIPFMRHALVFNIISLLTFVAAVFFLVTRGLHLSIEFTGGTVMEVNYTQSAPLDQVRTVVSGLGYTDFQVQNFGTSRDVMIRLPLAPVMFMLVREGTLVSMATLALAPTWPEFPAKSV